jgi:hypothetical protein
MNALLVPWKKDSPRLCATSVIFKKMPNENNNPIGENSPNLCHTAFQLDFRKVLEQILSDKLIVSMVWA